MKQRISSAIFFLVTALFFTGCLGTGLPNESDRTDEGEEITLEYWRLWDDSQIFEPMLKKFEESHPNVKVVYKKLLFDEYEKELIEAFAEDRGPDLYSIHNDWLPRYRTRLSPIPNEEGFMNIRTYKETFVDVAEEDLTYEDEIFGMPLYIDTMALFYNKDLLQGAGFTRPPETWEEFQDYVMAVTSEDELGNIELAGASIGTKGNVNRSVDILQMLMLQNGTPMIDKTRTQVLFQEGVETDLGETVYPGIEALQFYTEFANPEKKVYTWNNSLDDSIDMFVEGRSAMMFNYAYHIETVKNKASKLNFAVAPTPQIKEANLSERSVIANYWAEVVSNKSKHTKEAWELIQFLTSHDTTSEYLEKTKRPTARRDLIELQRTDPALGVFAEQSLIADSWFKADNYGAENALGEAIDNVTLGLSSPKEAVDQAATQIEKNVRDLLEKERNTQ